MSADLEKSLAAELARAAGHAPAPADDLRARVEAGYRLRKRRFAALYAAGAVVVLSGGIPFAVGAVASTPPAPATRPTSAPDKSYPAIEKVWPEAVHVIPATLPNGTPFRPELFLDDDTVLVRTLRDGHADRTDGLWAYDITSRTARRLVRVTPPPKTVITASFISAGGGRLAWWTARKQQRKLLVDIWAAPVSGGPQRKVASFEGVPRFGGIDLAIAGDKAVWSMWGKGGVYQVPLSGGTPEPVPGSAGYTLISWPWAGSPGPGATQTDKKVVTFGTMIDLRTGQRTQASVEPFATCHVTWCLRGTTAVRRDGTGERELPGMPGTSGAMAPALDRFVTLLQAGEGERLRGQVLYDLRTGRAGALGLRPDARGRLATAALDYRAPGLFAYERDGKQVVVNLSKIK